MIKEIKAIHPEYIVMIKTGTFYAVYGKDASIISYIFDYQFKEVNDTITCGFPAASVKKVQAKLENSKINYLIIDRRSGYTVDFKMDFNNSNTYQKHYEISKTYVNNQRKINKIYNYLTENSKNANLFKTLKEIEKLVNEAGKI